MPPDPLRSLDLFINTLAPSGNAQSPFAVFDCDGTIIRGDIGEAMFYRQITRFLFRMSPASLWHDHPKREELHTLFESLAALPPARREHDRRLTSFGEHLLSWYFGQLAEGKTAKACADIVRLLAGFTPAEVRGIAEATLRHELSSPLAERKIGRFTLPVGVRYIRESISSLRNLVARGIDLIVVSGSNRWSVEAVLRPLGITPDRIAGIDLMEERGLLTGRVHGPVPVLEGKVDILKQRFPHRPALVFSDSSFDLPLFEYSAGLRVLINSRNGPERDLLMTGATQNGTWIVVDHPTFEEQT